MAAFKAQAGRGRPATIKARSAADAAAKYATKRGLPRRSVVKITTAAGRSREIAV